MSVALKPQQDWFTFGADPEGFIFNDKDEPVPAALFIPGTKHEPHKVKQGAIQVDGMAAEYNIDPAKTYSEFVDNNEAVISQLKTFLPKGYKLKFLPSVTFSQEVFDTTEDEYKELGCSADFNAWTSEVNPPPHPDNPLMRCAGGHLHIGWTADEELSTDHINNCNDLVKQLDWYLGMWSLRCDPDTNRRSLYGKAGACRYKPYGVEYRVLSNFWVANASMRLEMWNRMVGAINMMAKFFAPEKVPAKFNLMAQDCINRSQRDVGLEEAMRYPVLSLAGSSRW